MSLPILLTILINGICTGSLYGLVSAAFSFQRGALRTTNFAYGTLTIFGSYLMLQGMRFWGLHWVLVLPIMVLIFFVMGYVLRATILKTRDGNAQVIITSGIVMIVESLILAIWTAMPQNVLPTIPPSINIFFENGILSIPLFNILTFVVSTIVLLGFAAFLKYTWTGMSIRAVVQQKEAASLMGVDAEKMINMGFGVSFIMSAISAFIIGLQYSLEPTRGAFYQLMGFLVCLIAGLGNLKGGFWAGLIVGLISTAVNTLGFAQYHDPIIFTLFVVMLVLFPNGVFMSKKNISRAV